MQVIVEYVLTNGRSTNPRIKTQTQMTRVLYNVNYHKVLKFVFKNKKTHNI